MRRSLTALGILLALFYADLRGNAILREWSFAAAHSR